MSYQEAESQFAGWVAVLAPANPRPTLRRRFLRPAGFTIVEALIGMGHRHILTERPHGGGQAIWIDRQRGVLMGGSDPRKDGMALGY